MAATNNNNTDAVCAAAEFTEFFDPVINQEIPKGTNSRGRQ